MDEGINEFLVDSGAASGTGGTGCDEPQRLDSVMYEETESLFIKLEPQEISDYVNEDDEYNDDNSGMILSPNQEEDSSDDIESEIETKTSKKVKKILRLPRPTPTKNLSPLTLQNYTDEEIEMAFRKCYRGHEKSKRKKAKKLAGAKLTLFLGKVCTTLVMSKTSTYEERKHLYDLWLLKYKELLESKKFKGKGQKSNNSTRPNNSKRKLSQRKPSGKNTRTKSTASTFLEPNDIIVKTESGLNCPASLQSFTDDEISSAFDRCYRVSNRKISRTVNSPASLFGKVSTFLTQAKTSTMVERRYLYDLWKIKYKHAYYEVEQQRRKKLKHAKEKRRKYERRSQCKRQLEQHQFIQTAGVEYFQPHEFEDSFSCSRSRTSASQDISSINMPVGIDSCVKMENNSDSTIIPESASSIVPKTEIESDNSDNYSDDGVGSSIVKSMEKSVIKVIRIEPSKPKQCSGKRLTRSTKRTNKKFADENFTSESDSDLNEDDYARDHDYLPSPKRNDDEGSNLMTPGSPNAHADNESSKTDEKIICTVCGRPIRKNIWSFHLRTHFSYEEHKQFLIKRREKNIQIRKNERKNGSSETYLKTTSSESRLEQLKWLLQGSRKKTDSQGKSKTKRVRNLGRPNLNEKRDGNYGPVQCSHCGKVMSTVYRLKNHEFTQHGVKDAVKGQGYKCSICDRPYGMKTNMFIHMRTHLSMEEHVLFIKWPGTMGEFIERLNTGGDLSKPPTKKLKLKKNVKPGIRRIPNPKGRPRKRHHLYKNSDISRAVCPTISEQLETNTLPENNAALNSVGDTESGVSSDSAGMSLTSGAATTVDTNALNWTTVINQAANSFFVQNTQNNYY